MAELATVREPEWLKERRGDAARRAAELDLPRFKGKAGWEFTDITKLDLTQDEVVLLPQTRRHSLLAQLLRVPSIVFAIRTS